MFIMEPFLPISLGTLVGAISTMIPPLNLPIPRPLSPNLTFLTSSTSTILKKRTSPISKTLLKSFLSLPKTSDAGKIPGYGELMSTPHMENLTSSILPITTSPFLGRYLLLRGMTLIFLFLNETSPKRLEQTFPFSWNVPLPA